MSDKVGLCSHCRFPLVSTLVFRYVETYCMNCGGKFGMMDVAYADVSVKIAPFVAKAKRRFGQVRRYLIGGGMRRRDCEECEKGSEHLNHATVKEKKKYTWALNKLKEWEGSFGWEKYV